MDVVPQMPGEPAEAAGEAGKSDEVSEKKLPNSPNGGGDSSRKKAALAKLRIRQQTTFDELRAAMHDLQKDTYTSMFFHAILPTCPDTAKFWAYWVTHVIELFTFQWALGAISSSTSSQDQLYERLTSYYQNMGIMAMFFLGISTAVYFENVYLSPKENVAFVRLIVCSIALQVTVTLISSFFLMGLCTISTYKTSIFFESIRSSAQILEFAWLFSLITFIAALWYFLYYRSDDFSVSVAKQITYGFAPLALGAVVLLWMMVHRLRSQIWSGDDYLVGFDVGSLLHLLDYYIVEDIRDGQLNLNVEEFRGYVMKLAKEELKKEGASAIVVNGATFNQMTGDRIDRIWGILNQRLLDAEFADLEGKKTNEPEAVGEHAMLMNKLVKRLSVWEKTHHLSRSRLDGGED